MADSRGANMTGTSRLLVASAAVGGLMLLGFASEASAQAPELTSQRHVSSASGSIHGTIKDEKGDPVRGAMVTAQSDRRTMTFAMTDGDGRYELQALPPGSYVVRARLKGYFASPCGLSNSLRTSGPNCP